MMRTMVLVAAGALVVSPAMTAGFIDSRALADDTATVSEPKSSFIAPGAAARIVLPGRDLAAREDERGEIAAQKALLLRAEAEASASAEVRRRAEELSRRFVREDAGGAPPSDTPTESASAAVRAAEAAATPAASPAVALPLAGGTEATTSAIVTEPDTLGEARKLLMDAEARAAAERKARLAAEAEARIAIDQATEAIDKAQRSAEAASRRAAEAESRAMKATAAAAKAAAVPAGQKAPPAASPGQSQQANSQLKPPSPPYLLGIIPNFAK